MSAQISTAWMSRAADLSPVHTPQLLARTIAATFAATLVLGLSGCATSMLDSTVAVPDQFAAAPAGETESEVAWWERFADPALSDLIQRAARENRDLRIAAERVRAARAGETISRSWLLPEFRCRRQRHRSAHRLQRQRAAGGARHEHHQRRTQRLMGSRSQWATACGCSGGSGGHEGH